MQMNLAINFFIFCMCVCLFVCLGARVPMHVEFVSPSLLVSCKLSRTEIKLHIRVFFSPPFQENTGKHWTGSCV